MLHRPSEPTRGQLAADCRHEFEVLWRPSSAASRRCGRAERESDGLAMSEWRPQL